MHTTTSGRNAPHPPPVLEKKNSNLYFCVAAARLLSPLALRLQHPLLPRFKGQVLLAPAIKGNPPPAMLVAALRHLVVPLVPRWQIPSCLESGTTEVS